MADASATQRDAEVADSEVVDATDSATSLDADADLPPDGSLDSTTGAVDATADGLAGDPDGAVVQPQTACAEVSGSGDTLLSLGPSSAPRQLYLTADRIVASLGSVGSSREASWVIWDRTQDRVIAAGSLPCILRQQTACFPGQVIVRGGIMAIQLASEIEVRDISDGNVLGAIPHDSVWSTALPFGVAQDGSYVWTATAAGLATWSTAGVAMASRAGAHPFTEKVSAQSATLFVSGGPAGAQVIESISASTGQSTVSPSFLGTFDQWFSDGSKFFTRTGDVVRVYSSAAVQQKIVSLSAWSGYYILGGFGDYFWRSSSSRSEIYRVATESEPIWSGTQQITAVSEGFVLRAYQPSGSNPAIVDLHGADAVVHELGASPTLLSAFAATPAGDWLLMGTGVMYEKKPAAAQFRRLNCGAVWDIAGSRGSVVAVAVAAKQILVLDSAARALQAVIPFDAERLAMSSDGSVLLAYGRDALTLRAYQLPAAQLVHEFAPPAGTSARVRDFSLSPDGQRVAVTWQLPLERRLRVTNLTETATYLAQTSSQAAEVRLGAGNRLALSADPTTNLYLDAGLTGALTGLAAGWLDDARLLARLPAGSSSAMALFDSAGNELGRPSIPSISDFDVVGADVVYSPTRNTAYNVVTGAVVWSGSSGELMGKGTSSASQAIFLRGREIVRAGF